MFRQVMVNAEDTPFQRILWRDDRSQCLKTFELLTVAYGLSSSPFDATMTLSQLAEEVPVSCTCVEEIVLYRRRPLWSAYH